MVIDQGTVLDRIDYNIEKVVTYTEDAVQELDKVRRLSSLRHLSISSTILSFAGREVAEELWEETLHPHAHCGRGRPHSFLGCNQNRPLRRRRHAHPSPITSRQQIPALLRELICCCSADNVVTVSKRLLLLFPRGPRGPRGGGGRERERERERVLLVHHPCPFLLPVFLVFFEPTMATRKRTEFFIQCRNAHFDRIGLPIPRLNNGGKQSSSSTFRIGEPFW